MSWVKRPPAAEALPPGRLPPATADTGLADVLVLRPCTGPFVRPVDYRPRDADVRVLEMRLQLRLGKGVGAPHCANGTRRARLDGPDPGERRQRR